MLVSWWTLLWRLTICMCLEFPQGGQQSGVLMVLAHTCSTSLLRAGPLLTRALICQCRASDTLHARRGSRRWRPMGCACWCRRVPATPAPWVAGPLLMCKLDGLRCTWDPLHAQRFYEAASDGSWLLVPARACHTGFLDAGLILNRVLDCLCCASCGRGAASRKVLSPHVLLVHCLCSVTAWSAPTCRCDERMCCSLNYDMRPFKQPQRCQCGCLQKGLTDAQKFCMPEARRAPWRKPGAAPRLPRPRPQTGFVACRTRWR